jgi:hypothetical protein
LCERIAADIDARLSQTTVFTHLEPREDPASFADQGLDSRPVEAGDREAARSRGDRRFVPSVLAPASARAGHE